MHGAGESAGRGAPFRDGESIRTHERCVGRGQLGRIKHVDAAKCAGRRGRPLAGRTARLAGVGQAGCLGAIERPARQRSLHQGWLAYSVPCRVAALRSWAQGQPLGQRQLAAAHSVPCCRLGPRRALRPLRPAPTGRHRSRVWGPSGTVLAAPVSSWWAWLEASSEAGMMCCAPTAASTSLMDSACCAPPTGWPWWRARSWLAG